MAASRLCSSVVSVTHTSNQFDHSAACPRPALVRRLLTRLAAFAGANSSRQFWPSGATPEAAVVPAAQWSNPRPSFARFPHWTLVPHRAPVGAVLCSATVSTAMATDPARDRTQGMPKRYQSHTPSHHILPPQHPSAESEQAKSQCGSRACSVGHAPILTCY
jgi:hypothetical protein